MDVFFYIFWGIISYLWGSFSAGYYYYREKTGRDIRSEPEPGSGSTGWSNVKRLLGFKKSLPVLFADFLKGTLPAALGLWLFHNDLLAATLGFAAIFGHVYSCLIPSPKFHAGKGVASSAGMTTIFFLYYIPLVWSLLAILIGVLAWLITGRIVKKIKKRESAALANFMMLTVVFVTSGIFWLKFKAFFSFYFVAALAGMALIGWAHQSNIARALGIISKRKKPATETENY